MKILAKCLAIAALCLAGCGSGRSGAVAVDAGRFVTADRNQTGPGDIPAMARLAEEVKNNPDAATYTVTYQNVYPSGNVYPRTLAYDASEGTVTIKGNAGPGLAYGGVTNEIVSATAAAGQDAQELTSHGATRR